MTSNSDDLEEQLRQNLALRRRLGAELAKAEDGDQQNVQKPSRWAWVAKVQDGGNDQSDERPRPVASAEPAPDEDELDRLRETLKSRRLTAGPWAETQDSAAHHGAPTQSGAIEPPDAAFEDGDDLGALRQTLKQRTQRGAEIIEAEETASDSARGLAYWFGQGLYWGCLTLGLVWMAGYSFVVINSPTGSSQLLTPAVVAALVIPALLLSGIGRDLRYVLCRTQTENPL